MKAIKNFVPATVDESPTIVGQIEMRNVKELKQSPEQARTLFDESALQELADSIIEHGILQPLVIRPDGTLVAGNRRWLAAKIARMVEVPCIVRDCDSSLESYLLGAIENLQRADLSPMEEANLYLRMVVEYKMNQTQIAAKLGKPRLRVQRMLALANADSSIQEAIASKALSWSTAQEIENLMSTPEDKAAAVEMVAQGHATREEIRELAKVHYDRDSIQVPNIASPVATKLAIYRVLADRDLVRQTDADQIAALGWETFPEIVKGKSPETNYDDTVLIGCIANVKRELTEKNEAQQKATATAKAYKKAVARNEAAASVESGESMSDVPLDVPMVKAQASSQEFENEIRDRMDELQAGDSKLEILRAALRKIVYYGIGNEDSDNIRNEHVIALSKIAQEALEAAFEVA